MSRRQCLLGPIRLWVYQLDLDGTSRTCSVVSEVFVHPSSVTWSVTSLEFSVDGGNHVSLNIREEYSPILVWKRKRLGVFTCHRKYTWEYVSMCPLKALPRLSESGPGIKTLYKWIRSSVMTHRWYMMVLLFLFIYSVPGLIHAKIIREGRRPGSHGNDESQSVIRYSGVNPHIDRSIVFLNRTSTTSFYYFSLNTPMDVTLESRLSRMSTGMEHSGNWGVCLTRHKYIKRRRRNPVL